MVTLIRTTLFDESVMTTSRMPSLTGRTIFTAVMVLASVVTGGCNRSNNEWKTLRIAKGSQRCRVVVYSPPYGATARDPDAVTVFWDGEQVFKGVLPTGNPRFSGMPVKLLEIHSDSGDHVLEVITSKTCQKLNLNLEDNDTHHFRIFGLKNGKETVIKDLGSNPMFR